MLKGFLKTKISYLGNKRSVVCEKLFVFPTCEWPACSVLEISPRMNSFLTTLYTEWLQAAVKTITGWYENIIKKKGKNVCRTSAVLIVAVLKPAAWTKCVVAFPPFPPRSGAPASALTASAPIMTEKAFRHEAPEATVTTMEYFQKNKNPHRLTVCTVQYGN